MIRILSVTVPVFCTKFKKWACGGQRPTHPASGPSSDQMSEASARGHERRVFRRKEARELSVFGTSGHLHRGRAFPQANAREGCHDGQKMVCL